MYGLMVTDCLPKGTFSLRRSRAFRPTAVEHFVKIASDQFVRLIAGHPQQSIVAERHITSSIHAAETLADDVQDHLQFSTQLRDRGFQQWAQGHRRSLLAHRRYAT